MNGNVLVRGFACVASSIVTVLAVGLCLAGTLGLVAAQGDEASAAIRARTDAYVRVWDAHDASGLAASGT
jgi:hypothetical protein